MLQTLLLPLCCAVHTFHRELPTSVLLSDLAYIKLYLPRTIATDAKQPPNQASLLAPVHSLWVSSLATVEQLVVYFLKSMGLGWALYLWGGAKHAMLGTGNNDAGSHHSHSCWDNNNSVGSYPQHINCDRSSSPRNLQQQGSSTCQAASHSGDTYPVWVVERPGAFSSSGACLGQCTGRLALVQLCLWVRLLSSLAEVLPASATLQQQLCIRHHLVMGSVMCAGRMLWQQS
jgi:hypothetical protein